MESQRTPQNQRVFRTLQVVLTPGPNRGEIDAMLYGELGTILTWIERQAIGNG